MKSFTNFSLSLAALFGYLLVASPSLTKSIAQDSVFVTLVGQIALTGAPMGVDVNGNYAYVVSNVGTSDSLFIIDVSDPSNPVRVSERETSGALSIDVLGNYAYTGGSWFEVWDVSNPLSPTKTDSVNVTGNILGLFVSGSIAFIAKDSRHLGTYDVSDPFNLSAQLSSIWWGVADLNDVFVDGALAYAVNEDSGIFAVDAGDPSNLTLLGTLHTPGVASGVFVSGDNAYIADGTSGLRIIDVTDPLDLIETGVYNTPGFAKDVTVSENFAYVADNTLGMRVIYAKDPSNPNELGHYNAGGFAEDIVFANSLIYVADQSNGLLIFRKQIAVAELPPESFTGTSIPLTVSDLTGLGVSGIEFTFKYDSTLIDTGTLVFFDSTSLLWGTDWILEFNPSTPGSVAIALTAGINELIGADTLFNVVFEGKTGAARGTATALDFGKALFNEGEPLVIAEPVTVIVGFPYGDITGNGEVTAYDASFVFKHALGAIQLDESQQVKADVSGNGVIDEFDVSLILQFVVGLITRFPVEDSSAVLLAATGEMNLNDISVVPGESFSIPVELRDGEDIISGSFTTNYDPAILTIQSVDKVNLTADYMFAHVEQEGSFRVLFAGAHPINGDGQIAELKFNISDDASADAVISITDIKLNGEMIETSGDSASVILTTTDVSEGEKSTLPDKFTLEQNYPNPFNPSTEIRFSLPFSSEVQLLIYDLHGQLIKTLASGFMPPGNHSISWNGENAGGNRVSSGMYLYKLSGTSPKGTFSRTRKMLLLR